jgi:calmodulin
MADPAAEEEEARIRAFLSGSGDALERLGGSDSEQDDSEASDAEEQQASANGRQGSSTHAAEPSDGGKGGKGGKVKVTLSPEQIEHFRDAYNIFDKNGDGGVTVNELAHVMRCIGQEANDQEVRRMFSEVDRDGSGEISFEEFLEIMQMQLGSKAAASSEASRSGEFSREDWAQAFKIFDLNGDGFIDPSELGTVLANMGEKLESFELQEMVQEVCTDESGKLSLDMFIDVMVKGITLPSSSP